jgi:hypothetical protein
MKTQSGKIFAGKKYVSHAKVNRNVTFIKLKLCHKELLGFGTVILYGF